MPVIRQNCVKNKVFLCLFCWVSGKTPSYKALSRQNLVGQIWKAQVCLTKTRSILFGIFLDECCYLWFFIFVSGYLTERKNNNRQIAPSFGKTDLIVSSFVRPSFVSNVFCKTEFCHSPNKINREKNIFYTILPYVKHQILRKIDPIPR